MGAREVFFLPARSGNLSLSPLRNHSEEGEECFGAPIFNAEWQVVAFMSFSGPGIQITAQPDAIRNAIVENTQRISRVLGYVRPSSSAETNSQDLIAHILAMSQSNEH